MSSPVGSLGSRIKEAREAKGLNQAALGRVCSVSRASVSQWESDGTEPTGTNLVRIARALGVTEAWLTEGKGTKAASRTGATSNPPAAEVPTYDFFLVPEISIQAGMGPGGLQEVETFGGDTIRDTWGLPNDYVRGELRIRPEDLRIIDLKGDSMAPTLIGTDRAIIDVADRIPSPPGIFAIWDGHGVLVKRIEIVPKSKPVRLRVISDNTLHQPYEIEAEDHTIIGRLRGFIRRL